MTDVLVLNFSYEALNVTSARRAIKLLFAGKAELVQPGSTNVASTSFQMRMPSVIRMLYYVRRPMRQIALTKHNVLLRDDYTCKYCGRRDEQRMTIDHVIPRSKGGASTWENLVCACMACNNRKNDKTPEGANMPLLTKPRAPRYVPWIRVHRSAYPSAWRDFLFVYNVSIDERIE